MTAIHDSLTQTLHLEAPARAVFKAFSDPPLRVRWFRIPAEPGTARHELDFRPGGHELLAGTVAVAGARERIEYRARFLDGSAEIAEREGGTRLLLNRLRAAVTASATAS